MSEAKKFESARQENIRRQGESQKARSSAMQFIVDTAPYNYTYNYTWMGRPIIQFPQDILAMQELIWTVKPDLIIETGIAHGGSIVFSASMLELVGGEGKVLGIDIDIRKHNREEIEKHPMFKRIMLLEGSSVADETIAKVKEISKNAKTVLVILDSNHTHEHVLEEMKLYAPLVSVGSYLIVYDTIVEDMPDGFDFGDRPWGKGNNPKTAVHEFMKTNKNFVIDKEMENKLMITVGPDGYLKRIS